jgi:hypothetical protein
LYGGEGAGAPRRSRVDARILLSRLGPLT